MAVSCGRGVASAGKSSRSIPAGQSISQEGASVQRKTCQSLVDIAMCGFVGAERSLEVLAASGSYKNNNIL